MEKNVDRRCRVPSVLVSTQRAGDPLSSGKWGVRSPLGNSPFDSSLCERVGQGKDSGRRTELGPQLTRPCGRWPRGSDSGATESPGRWGEWGGPGELPSRGQARLGIEDVPPEGI